MFSSNQIFQVSGDFSQLIRAIRFALVYSGYSKSTLTYQTTDNGKYCIGWKPYDGVPCGWIEYGTKYDTVAIAKSIEQFLSGQDVSNIEYQLFDGSTTKGFLMKGIENLFSDEYEGIKKPFYGIVSFELFVNCYAK